MSTNNDKFTVDTTRVKPYFDQWHYKIRLGIKLVHHFRSITNSKMLALTITRNVIGKHQYYMRWRETICASEIDHRAIEAYYRWRDSVTDLASRTKITISEHCVHIYTNEADIADSLCDELEKLNASASNVWSTIQRYRIDVPKNFQSDAIYRVNPRNKFRVYLHAHRYTQQEFDEVRNFFSENAHITPSFSLRSALYRTRRGPLQYQYTWKNLFYDLDDEQEIIVLALKFPELVRCYCRILPRNPPLILELNDK